MAFRLRRTEHPHNELKDLRVRRVFKKKATASPRTGREAAWHATGERMVNVPETRKSLILRLRDAADASAWAEFDRVYRPALYRFARGRGFQHADAENLVQEVLVSVSRGVRFWSPEPERGRFRAWLFRIARNKTINFLTRPRHQPLGAGGSSLLRWLDHQPALSGESWAALDQEYRQAVLRWAMNQVRRGVTEKTWQAFALTYLEEVPVEEAANRLGMSCGAVYIARSRVLARLNQIAQQLGGEPEEAMEKEP